MSFRIAARTILQLGAELISSDSIAFYELIKNAFDAGSPRVDIDVIVRMDHDCYIAHRAMILDERKMNRGGADEKSAINKCKKRILRDIDPSAPDVSELKKDISEAASWDDLIETLDEVNYIRIDDTGSGMSLKDLDEIYLTIGTRSRLKEREVQRKRFKGKTSEVDFRPILGEKGIGRLSAMRLGSRLWVKTSKKGEPTWNNLDIDWNRFSNDSDDMVEDIEIRPTKGNRKKDPNSNGTLIWISALRSDWYKKKLENIATSEFCKLMDPFTRRYKFPISLRLNKMSIPIRRFDKILFEAAHAKVWAEFTVEDDKPRLFGKVNYILRNREKTISLDLNDLHTITEVTDRLPSILKSLGTFKVEFYWYNRRVLEEIEGIGTKTQVKKLVNEWSGGLMVFRDGFRVNPYGNPDDDWLDLDRKAFASGGYKVNRTQIIGKVDISSIENAVLVDQTNREGLRDCDEKQVLIKILKHILQSEFHAFLNIVDNEVQAKIPVTFEDLEDRVGNEEKRIRRSLKMLRQKYPEVKKDKQIFSSIEDAIEKIRRLMNEAQGLADSFESGHTKLLNLAGLGLMVEIIAHELNRATRHTLKTLADTDELTLDEDVESVFETLESQLKTLQKRLRILDPMSTAGRQVKEKFDLVAWVKEILSSHEAQFWRHNIKCSVEVKPASRATKGFPVKMVKGMIVQIMENLLSNSVYWLKQQKMIEKGFSPEIVVTIGTQEKEIQFTDNGPGVPLFRKEEIFQPFVTTKPPGEGKGLGLFISREIVKYHGASIYMSEEQAVHDDRLNTFILSLEGNQR